MRLTALALVFVTGAAHVAAQSCNAYLFPQSVTAVSAATVTNMHAPLYRDDEGCPDKGEACKGKAYLVAGNEVLVAGTHGAYRCVVFFNGRRQTTGWITVDSLTPSPTPSPQAGWSGTWKRLQGDSVITIRKVNATFTAEAITTYAVSRDNVRTGTANGKLQLTALTSGIQIASFGESGADRTQVCRVQLRQFGPRLLADDGVSDDSNSACGGMGVTFNGIYLRSTAKPIDSKSH